MVSLLAKLLASNHSHTCHSSGSSYSGSALSPQFRSVKMPVSRRVFRPNATSAPNAITLQCKLNSPYFGSMIAHLVTQDGNGGDSLSPAGGQRSRQIAPSSPASFQPSYLLNRAIQTTLNPSFPLALFSLAALDDAVAARTLLNNPLPTSQIVQNRTEYGSGLAHESQSFSEHGEHPLRRGYPSPANHDAGDHDYTRFPAYSDARRFALLPRPLQIACGHSTDHSHSSKMNRTMKTLSSLSLNTRSSQVKPPSLIRLINQKITPPTTRPFQVHCKIPLRLLRLIQSLLLQACPSIPT